MVLFNYLKFLESPGMSLGNDKWDKAFRCLVLQYCHLFAKKVYSYIIN